VYIGERIKPLRKQHLAHMADQMPHEWPHERWVEALRSVNPFRSDDTAPAVILRSYDSIQSKTTVERVW